MSGSPALSRPRLFYGWLVVAANLAAAGIVAIMSRDESFTRTWNVPAPAPSIVRP